MTNSPPSSSDPDGSQGFGLLDERIQRWIWSSGWTELRDAQERSIPLILAGEQDVIIAASTASGKTEAAFLPILSHLGAPGHSAACVIYVSPLKALINDQWGRLEALAESLEIPVTPWHGDISQTRKTRFMKDPRGCLLITPESLEALLIRQGHGLSGLLKGLCYVVVDELHAFMGSERGKQLQSLLHRIERALGRRVCRIGLSATLGDMVGAAEFLRPGEGDRTALIVSRDKGQELKVLVRGILESTPNPGQGHKGGEGPEDEGAARFAVADHLFRALRGSNNLVFPNRRSDVEFYADQLRRKCETEGFPNEFWPHHGSLAKEIREEAEAALKQKERPATAICTTTLELGIDIGSVRSVAQVGTPPSVASLRQRLGRSGRRKGEPAILRAYCIEERLTSRSPISDQLREGLVQTIAMVRLLIEGWYEPVRIQGLHASTLVQQVLSSIAQHGGLQAGRIWALLCDGGPFQNVLKAHFLDLVRELGRQEVLFQDPTGLILLAPLGERIVEHYSFYAAFTSIEEFRIVMAGRTIGSMPVTRPLQEGSHIIFAGRRWLVLHVSMEDLVVEVESAGGGAVPAFDGALSAKIHGRVREEMFQVLSTSVSIPFLDGAGQGLLSEARENFSRLGLCDRRVLAVGASTCLIPWDGDWAGDTLQLLLCAEGLKAMNEGLCISVEGADPNSVRAALKAILDHPPESEEALAATVVNKLEAKWDGLLPIGLLDANYAAMNLDLADGLKLAARLYEGMES